MQLNTVNTIKIAATLKEKYFGQLDKARDIIITKPNKQGKNKKHQCQQSIEADVMS